MIGISETESKFVFLHGGCEMNSQQMKQVLASLHKAKNIAPAATISGAKTPRINLGMDAET